MPCLDTIAKYLFFAFVIDFSLEMLDLIHRIYEAGDSFGTLDFMVKTRLFVSHIVIQICLGTVLPILLLAATQVIRLSEIARRRIYAAAGVLTLVGIFAMRWNVVIGGQLFSKSLLGYTTYKMEFATREGLLPAIVIMVLPFVILAVLLRLLPPWGDEAQLAGNKALSNGDLARRSLDGLRPASLSCTRVTGRSNGIASPASRRGLAASIRRSPTFIGALTRSRRWNCARRQPFGPNLSPRPSRRHRQCHVLSAGGLDFTGLVSLVGRTFVVLGGAYLLRAFTESGRLPGRAGVVLGLAYAVAWFGAADRAAVTRPLSGLFHGLAAVVISLPLLWEASAHFKLLSPQTSAALLSLIAGLALGVAWHRHLQSLAGVAVVGSIVATAGLMVATGYPLPFATGLLALGACTLWLSDARTWPWLRWLPAFAADLVALVLVGRAVVVPPQEPPGAVIALLLALVAVYLGSVAWRTLVRNQRVQGFEVIQTPCAVGIGLLGAVIVARGGPRLASLALGALALLGAGAGYAAAFGILRRRPDGRANVVFFGTLAVGLLLIGSSASLSGPALVAWYGALAAGGRRARPSSIRAAVLASCRRPGIRHRGRIGDARLGRGRVAHHRTVAAAHCCDCRDRRRRRGMPGHPADTIRRRSRRRAGAVPRERLALHSGCRAPRRERRDRSVVACPARRRRTCRCRRICEHDHDRAGRVGRRGCRRVPNHVVGRVPVACLSRARRGRPQAHG